MLYACVKVLLPLACVLLLGATLWGLFLPERPGVPWRDYNPWSYGDWVAGGVASGFSFVVQLLLALVGLSLFGATVMWILYAAVTGRRIKQRLTDPEPIEEGSENLAKA